MKSTFSVLLIALFSLFTHSVFAGDDYVIGIDEVRINISSSMDGSAAYMEIINYTKDKPVTLTQVSSEAASDVRLRHAGKSAKALANGETAAHTVIIKARSAEELSDDGYYVHLEGLVAPITEGQRIPLLLTFEHGDSYLVDAVAVKPGTHLHGDGSEAHSDH